METPRYTTEELKKLTFRRRYNNGSDEFIKGDIALELLGCEREINWLITGQVYGTGLSDGGMIYFYSDKERMRDAAPDLLEALQATNDLLEHFWKMAGSPAGIGELQQWDNAKLIVRTTGKE